MPCERATMEELVTQLKPPEEEVARALCHRTQRVQAIA